MLGWTVVGMIGGGTLGGTREGPALWLASSCGSKVGRGWRRGWTHPSPAERQSRANDEGADGDWVHSREVPVVAAARHDEVARRVPSSAQNPIVAIMIAKTGTNSCPAVA